jgi:hypothetical protein
MRPTDVQTAPDGVQAGSEGPVRSLSPEQGSNKPQRVTCVYHCSSMGGCDRHFASLEAFDLHRPGRTGQRKCADPTTVRDDDGNRRLIAKSEDGHCAIGHGHPVNGVTVWQTPHAAVSNGWA